MTAATEFKQTVVEIEFVYMSGADCVPAEEAKGMVITGATVNGFRFTDEFFTLVNDGPFLTIKIHDPEEPRDNDWFRSWQQQIRDLRASMDVGSWLDETDDEVLVLPVSRISWREDVRY